MGPIANSANASTAQQLLKVWLGGPRSRTRSQAHGLLLRGCSWTASWVASWADQGPQYVLQYLWSSSQLLTALKGLSCKSDRRDAWLAPPRVASEPTFASQYIPAGWDWRYRWVERNFDEQASSDHWVTWTKYRFASKSQDRRLEHYQNTGRPTKEQQWCIRTLDQAPNNRRYQKVRLINYPVLSTYPT